MATHGPMALSIGDRLQYSSNQCALSHARMVRLAQSQPAVICCPTCSLIILPAPNINRASFGIPPFAPRGSVGVLALALASTGRPRRITALLLAPV